MKNVSMKMLNAKKRIILLLVVAAVGVGGALFYWHHYSNEKAANSAEVSLSSAPNIQSVPGAGNPSNQYVQDQNLQNTQEEVSARKDATSAIPTITRPGFVGSPNEFLQQLANQNGTNSSKHECNIKKVVVMYKPNPANCSLKNLQLARESGVTAEELVCQGCACPLLKAAGYTAADLKSIGETAKQLRDCGFTLGQLVAAGFSPTELKDAGYTAKQLANDGFTAGQLAAAGYTPEQLEKAGFTKEQLAAAGVTNPICNVQALRKAREQGVSAETLRNDGCGLAALKAAGFSAKQLKDAGFSAAQLKNAGFSDAQLKAAGFAPSQIAAALDTAKSCSVAKLEKERLAGVSAADLKSQGCGLAALKAAGFSAAQLKAAGFSAKQLKAAGFSAQQLKDAGFSAGELKNAGFSAKQLKDAGFSAAQLKNAGFSASALKNAGFSAGELKAAGFNAGELRAAGFTASQLKNAGFTPSELHKAGFNAAELHNAGFSADQLRNAGFSKGDLLRAGFTPEQAGYASVPQEVKNLQQVNTPSQQSAVDTDALNASANVPSINGNSPEARLAQLEKQQQQQLTEQERQDAVQRQQGAMTLEAQKLLAGWSNNSLQVGQKAIPTENTSGNNADQTGQNAINNGKTVKAGTIWFAVLDTSINSDEQTPIMAKIVAGPLKGSRLLGRFDRVGTKVFIRFNLLSVPTLDSSLSINAVAIDPDTARTALSGNVNHHYLLRYGTLFASAFLSGVSNAILNSNTVQQCFGPFCVNTQKKLSTGQVALVGLGQVGDRVADNLGSTFNRPPTIKIPAGVGMGILVMRDFSLPTPPAEANNNSNSNNSNNS